MSEWTLSDKINEIHEGDMSKQGIIWTGYVKEFIRRLKHPETTMSFLMPIEREELIDIINKLAGEDLQ